MIRHISNELYRYHEYFDKPLTIYIRQTRKIQIILIIVKNYFTYEFSCKRRSGNK